MRRIHGVTLRTVYEYGMADKPSAMPVVIIGMGISTGWQAV
jgi:hypothetical protein